MDVVHLECGLKLKRRVMTDPPGVPWSLNVRESRRKPNQPGRVPALG